MPKKHVASANCYKSGCRKTGCKEAATRAMKAWRHKTGRTKKKLVPVK